MCMYNYIHIGVYVYIYIEREIDRYRYRYIERDAREERASTKHVLSDIT